MTRCTLTFALVGAVSALAVAAAGCSKKRAAASTATQGRGSTT
mgnify:CR=1 FL=1